MKTLIIARHGHATPLDVLTDRGRTQIHALARSLKNIVPNGSSVRILYSCAERAHLSARLLGRTLLTKDTVEEDVLYSDDSYIQTKDATDAIRKHLSADVDVLIVVTHYELATALPRLFGANMQTSIFQHGQAAMINLETGESEFLA